MRYKADFYALEGWLGATPCPTIKEGRLNPYHTMS
jgi:hypothetical protein